MNLPLTSKALSDLQAQIAHVESEGLDSGARRQLLALSDGSELDIPARALWWWYLSEMECLEYLDGGNYCHSIPSAPEDAKSEIREYLWSFKAAQTDQISLEVIKQLAYEEEVIGPDSIQDMLFFLNDDVGAYCYRVPESGELKITSSFRVRDVDGRHVFSQKEVAHVFNDLVIDISDSELDDESIGAVLERIDHHADRLGVVTDL